LAVAVYKDSVINELSGPNFTDRLMAKDGKNKSYFSPELSTELGHKYVYVDSMGDSQLN